jgi:uncharacterized membrane protein
VAVEAEAVEAEPGEVEPAATPPIDTPSRSDEFVRGTSEAIGGPLGRHAVTGGVSRFRTVSVVVLLLTCFVLLLHWMQKSPCEDGNWNDLKQYKRMCYTDILALYYAEGLADGKVPYRDRNDTAQPGPEYPVLTGAFMGLLGLPVHSIARRYPQINQGEWFWNLNVLVLGAIAVASAAAMLVLRRRRPWDIAMFATAPILLLTATVNWDLLAVGFAVFGLYAWAKRHPVWAGVLLGLGTAAKLWPGFLFIALVLLGFRRQRVLEALVSLGVGIVTWLAVNLPVALLYPHSWWEFFRLNQTRAVDWGTFWYIGQHFPVGGQLPGFGWMAAHIPALDRATYILFALCCVAIGCLIFAAPSPPRVAQIAFLVVAAFLLFSKVWSQQYVLWLLPLAVLARPRWGAFLAWQVAELCYFTAFYGELMGASGKSIFPEWVFVTAAMLRLLTVAVLVGFVVRDVLRPERDAVRQTYGDDPDGGVFVETEPVSGWRPPALAGAAVSG